MLAIPAIYYRFRISNLTLSFKDFSINNINKEITLDIFKCFSKADLQTKLLVHLLCIKTSLVRIRAIKHEYFLKMNI